MGMRILLVGLAATLSLYTQVGAACDDGHRIKSVSSEGRYVVLDDGSTWEVHPLDSISSMLWSPVAKIVACERRLINTDKKEMVAAMRVK